MTGTVNRILLAQNIPPDYCCTVCFLSVSKQTHLLGPAVIHKNGENRDGEKHPIHLLCLVRSVQRIPSCPSCRAPIHPETSLRDLFPPKKSLIHKLRNVAIATVATTALHALATRLIGSSLVAAALPGLSGIPLTAYAIYQEWNDLGISSLKKVLKDEFLISAAITTIPMANSFIASRLTNSILPNSFMTAALTISEGFFVFHSKVMNPLTFLDNLADQKIQTIGQISRLD